jgi:hypothetical protein
VECAEIWLCDCHNLSACIPGESKQFKNDIRRITVRRKFVQLTSCLGR